MDVTVVEPLLKDHLSIWPNRDEQERKSLIRKIYDKDVQIVDPFFVLNGWDELNQFIQKLQQEHPNSIFQITQTINSHHEIVRLHWQFGPSSDPGEIPVEDVFVFKDGKIKLLMVFIDNPK